MGYASCAVTLVGLCVYSSCLRPLRVAVAIVYHADSSRLCCLGNVRLSEDRARGNRPNICHRVMLSVPHDMCDMQYNC